MRPSLRCARTGKTEHITSRWTSVAFTALAAALLVTISEPGLAAYLENVPQELLQPDGTVVQCFATGDEYYHWLHDANGFVIVRDPATGFFVYAAKADGKLVPTACTPGVCDPLAAGLQPRVKPDPDVVRLKYARFAMPEAVPLPRPEWAPTFTSLNNLVIFVRFSDETEFTNPLSSYTTMFNASSGVSMSTYFKEASYNQTTIGSIFYPTSGGGSVVSYQDSHPRAYYQPYDATSNPQGYNGDDEARDREHTLVKNACEAIASQVNAMVNIDTNGDGRVDNVTLVVRGAADGWNDLLWPHRWALYTLYTTINGKQVYAYNFQLDASLGVSVLCHEMGHSLGAPDLYHYDTCSSAPDLDPVWRWDLMANNRTPPQHSGAYMKKTYFGWINTIPEITTSGTYTLNPIASSTNNAYKIASPNSTAEYFVVEYRRATGSFETSLPGSGLIITRIYPNADPENPGNRCGPPDEVYVYRPNGTTSANGDTASANFSADVGRTAINDSTNPSSFLSDGSAGGLNISNVTTAGSTISFNVTLGGGGGGGGGGGTTTIFSDGFEGSFPGSWTLSPSSPTTGWGKSTYRVAGGSYSLWCAGGGTSPQPAGGTYVPNMDNYVKYGPFSLADATAASAEFDLWLSSESGYDRMWWLVSLNGTNWYGWNDSGYYAAWRHITFDFSTVSQINVIGASQVWFAINFDSDSNTQYEGAYVDNLVIKKTTAGTSCTYSINPASTAVAAGGGSGTVGVTAGSGCAWTAVSNTAWLTVTGGSSGTGNGTVSYSVGANASASSRSGTITIADKTFTVNQSGTSCTSPLITQQPQSQTIASGASATLSVSVTGGSPFTYQWYRGSSGDTSSPIAGATSSSYITPPLTVMSSYWVQVSNSCGSVSSTTAVITVTGGGTTTYYLPAIAHNPGNNNTQWRSDLSVVNTSAGSTTITLTYYSSGAPMSQAATIAGSGTVKWWNVLETLFGLSSGTSSQGTVVITSNVPLAITARTYNQAASGSFGQFYPAVQSGGLLLQNQTAYLPLLEKSSAFRTNVGALNLGGGDCTVEFRVYGASGSQFGSAVSLNVPAGRWAQLNDLFGTAAAGSPSTAYAKVKPTSAACQIWSYGAVVDNVTGDPTTVPMIVP